MDRTVRCQRTVDVEGGYCVDDTGCSTVVLSMRHISEWRTEHAAHHMDGVLSVRHITWMAYERATHREIDIQKRASGQKRHKRDSSLRNVVRGSVK